MPNNLIALSRCATGARDDYAVVAYHRQRYYRAGEFRRAVGHWASRFKVSAAPRLALYTEDAYPFAVLLLALLHAGKQVWLPGTNRPGTASQLRQQGCELLGDWPGLPPLAPDLEIQNLEVAALAPLDPEHASLVIFTSGATGEPKPIHKLLRQLQLEVDTLERLWGQQLGAAEVLATVSHQHIYGLLFRVLWPLSAGRCLHSALYQNPESLASNSADRPACWIASPAQLKRLDADSPWAAIAGLKAVFSSGGALPEAASQQIFLASGITVQEIYGSSETGGIAFRQRPGSWRLFDGMSLSRDGQRWRLASPYLEADSTLLDDDIELLNDGRFLLLGRCDRIVKIEEKRVSLTELERGLLATPWVSDAFATALARRRDVVAAAVALSDTGQHYLQSRGRRELVKALREALHARIDALALPRRWLLLDALPTNPQGKHEHHLLTELLALDGRKFPRLHGITGGGLAFELSFTVPEQLLYFADHFRGYPLLPGVVQIAWADRFGHLLFAIAGAFEFMETVKFIAIIPPGLELTLTLNWRPATGKLHFNYHSAAGAHSSGRLSYRTTP